MVGKGDGEERGSKLRQPSQCPSLPRRHSDALPDARPIRPLTLPPPSASLALITPYLSPYLPLPLSRPALLSYMHGTLQSWYCGAARACPADGARRGRPPR